MPEEERERSAGEDAEFPSGPWTGYWLQQGHRGEQDLVLGFREGRLDGSGHDEIGGFTVRGRYDVETKVVWFHKTYPGSHSVYYRGYRELKGIWGTWEIGAFASGGFHIWPEGEGDGRRAARAEQERVASGPRQPEPARPASMPRAKT